MLLLFFGFLARFSTEAEDTGEAADMGEGKCRSAWFRNG